jgi:hypothetical protein
MLTIRQEQVEILARERRKPFVCRQLPRLRTAFPQETARLDDQSLLLSIDKDVGRAARYDVVNEHDLELFIDCTFMVGPDFDISSDSAWASEILNQPGLTGSEKMSLIHDRMLFSGY